MGARSGNNYLSALRRLKAEVWIGGQRVEDVTTHPALVHGARSVASLYDLQGEHPEAMTFRTAEGDRVGLSFIQPKSLEELRKRTAMFRRWAEYSHGMMGRTPDYLNTALAALASAHEFFGASEPRSLPSVQSSNLPATCLSLPPHRRLMEVCAQRSGAWSG